MSNNQRLYRGKYHSDSNRLNDWNYGSPGFYFVTICSQNKIHWFGEVHDDQVVLSDMGIIASEGVQKIEQLHPTNRVNSWIVMPNHVHVIIEIIENSEGGIKKMDCVAPPKSKWRTGVLGVIINQYKSYCTKRIRSIGYPNFAWQAGYYDHIVRNENSLKSIYLYILGNPAKWTDDEYYSH